MATRKTATGVYTPKNPQKYVGKGAIKYRSSWEMAFMSFLDNHPAIIQWASESIKIPYRNPLTGKSTIYVPDFFIMYVNAGNQRSGEIVEIKPLKETTLSEARSTYDKLMVVVNQAKWAAAKSFCAKNNLKFRVLTEQNLFRK